MTVSAPPRPPSPARTAPESKPLDREEIEALVEALIEEARREQRRRHRRYWALAALAALVGVVVLILLDGGAASQTASPAVSAQSNAATRTGPSRIVFVRGDYGRPCRQVSACDNGLYAINADGTGLRRLTRNAALGPGYSADPVWSPDGRKLVFVKRVGRSGAPCRVYSCDKELYVMNGDGTGLRRLTRNAALGPGYSADPVWSPDGRKLVFVKRVGRSGAPCRVYSCDKELYVMNGDGTGLRRLTRNTVYDGSPVWLPDGARIGFLRSINGRDEIYVMNADGSDQRRLTLLPSRAFVVGGAPGGDLTWSPEAEKIAFIAYAGHLGRPDIFVMNADGSGLRNVTNTVTTSFDVTWSPDGRRIAYLDGSPGGAPLYVVNADGTGKQRLTGPVMVDLGSPSWSPDGRTLAFTGRGGDIYTVHADGTGLRKLTAGPGWNVGSEWSPDGRRILFSSSRDDRVHRTFDLFVMNADGSGQRNLTHTPGVSEHAASWAPG